MFPRMGPPGCLPVAPLTSPQPTCGSGRGGETPKPTGTHPYWLTTAWLSPNGVFGLRNRRVELGRGRMKRTVGGTGRCLVPTPECEDQYKVTPRNDSASARPADRFRMGCVCGFHNFFGRNRRTTGKMAASRGISL